MIFSGIRRLFVPLIAIMAIYFVFIQLAEYFKNNFLSDTTSFVVFSAIEIVFTLFLFCQLATILWEKTVIDTFTPPFDRDEYYRDFDEHQNDLKVHNDLAYYLSLNSIFYMIKGYNCAKKFPHSDKLDQDVYHAIIIVPNLWAKKIMYANGIDLLISHFRAEGIHYKIFEITKPKELKEIVSDNNALYLWIFGHGNRHGISFGSKSFFYYDYIDELRNKSIKLPKKRFIAQFHCNTGFGKSLADYLVDDSSKRYVSDKIRYIFQNREDIKRIINSKSYL
ncbi:MAG: hypothetical protein QCI00_10050 [Candidatus Thermoplasmatota archaeon]|nr:hypothetical protein [Candidatus Thermoplasmatota archaeon]